MVKLPRDNSDHIWPAVFRRRIIPIRPRAEHDRKIAVTCFECFSNVRCGETAASILIKSAAKLKADCAATQSPAQCPRRRQPCITRASSDFSTGVRSSSDADSKLLLRIVALARPPQRLAPFEMQAAPVRARTCSLPRIREREIGAALRDQRFAPHLQWIGERGPFLWAASNFAIAPSRSPFASSTRPQS